MIKFVMKKNSALIPARVAVPMGPHTRAHGHRYAGWWACVPGLG